VAPRALGLLLSEAGLEVCPLMSGALAAAAGGRLALLVERVSEDGVALVR
jgi:hypothetical protein